MASPAVDGAERELKQQGAIEAVQNAAQDPQADVTAQDAEKVMIEETKKAGMPAYQFDPDASPEEKAAQAQSVSIESFFQWWWEVPWRLTGFSVSPQVFTMKRSQRGWLL